MAHEWNYNGDMNIKNGGFFWREDGSDDYVLAVRVTPCADAGGPDNLFVVECGSIYLPREIDQQRAAFECCGWTLSDDGTLTDYAGGVFKSDALRELEVDARMAYAGMERDRDIVIRIGRDESTDGRSGWNPSPDIVKPANLNLRRFIENNYLD